MVMGLNEDLDGQCGSPYAKPSPNHRALPQTAEEAYAIASVAVDYHVTGRRRHQGVRHDPEIHLRRPMARLVHQTKRHCVSAVAEPRTP
jgi:hypothetical protein